MKKKLITVLASLTALSLLATACSGGGAGNKTSLLQKGLELAGQLDLLAESEDYRKSVTTAQEMCIRDSIKTIRKSKGLSQEELAIKLHVVRQTISKWEQGLSVPDSEMLLSLSEALETPVSILLGESVVESQADDLKAISEKLEIINLQLAQLSLIHI